MFRHQDVAADNKVVPKAHCFKGPLRQVACRPRAEIWKSTLATEGEEVKTAALLITNKPLRHPNVLNPMSQNRVGALGAGHPIILEYSDLGHPPSSQTISRAGLLFGRHPFSRPSIGFPKRAANQCHSCCRTSRACSVPSRNRDLERSCVIYSRTIALWKLYLESVSRLLPIKPHIRSEKFHPPNPAGGCGSR
jgi:hypothetical protein